MKGDRLAFVAVLILALAAAAPAALAKGGKPGEPTAGNNLSFPVIWAEGVAKVLRGTPDTAPALEGDWWWWWGTDEDGNPLSCAPDPEVPSLEFCEDGDDLQETVPDELPGAGAIRVWPQQDFQNAWQADSYPPPGARPDHVVVPDWIDWGDNLESVDWYLNSKVRTEVVLIEDLDEDGPEPPLSLLQYGMRHLAGLGIDELWGLATDEDGLVVETFDPAPQGTVYTHCARLTIQKLATDRDDPALGELAWSAADHRWVHDTLVGDPLYNMAVYNADDGPSYYSAEINVKGKVIYGYTWDVKRLNDGVGDYRVTFSLDATCGSGGDRNTLFAWSDQGLSWQTEILQPVEGEEEVEEVGEEPEGGAVAQLDAGQGITWIDVRILDKRSGGGGGGKGKAK